MANQQDLPEVIHSGRFASDRSVDFHTHRGVELVMVTEGVCSYLVSDQALEAGVGGVFVLPARVPQRQESTGFARTSYVTFLCAPSVFSAKLRVISFGEDPVSQWIEQLVDITLAPGGPRQGSTQALMLAVLLRLNEIESRERELTHVHPALARALRIFDRELTEPFDAATLAQRCGISVSRLNALFREALGHSPLQWVTNLRMERACRLLPDPRLRVNDVARLCGFEDPGYFIRTFRKHHGQTPGKWRRDS